MEDTRFANADTYIKELHVFPMPRSLPLRSLLRPTVHHLSDSRSRLDGGWIKHRFPQKLQQVVEAIRRLAFNFQGFSPWDGKEHLLQRSDDTRLHLRQSFGGSRGGDGDDDLVFL